jgi:ribonuclease VapC
MFVDASAIVAIFTREPEADALADALDEAQSPITSPIAIFETVLAVCRKRHASVTEAQKDIRESWRTPASEPSRSPARKGKRRLTPLRATARAAIRPSLI